MRNRKLKKLLNLWQKNDLITQTQSENILVFMKERQRKVFFRLLKWLSIIGVFWLAFGVIATIINLMDLHCFHIIAEKISKFFSNIFHLIITDFVIPYILKPLCNFIFIPIAKLIYKIFGENSYAFYCGTVTFLLSGIFMFIDARIKPKKEIDELNISEEQKNVLKINWIFSTLSCLCLAATFIYYNVILLPESDFYSDTKIIPLWYVIGAISFTTLAYTFKKNLYLVFGIIFICLSVGMFTAYDSACYWLCVSMPVLQILVAVILLLVGYLNQLKCELKEKDDENANTYLLEKFGGTYNWAGLLLLFTALWIASFWGFDLKLSFEEGSAGELWIANILFILASVSSMLYGAKTEQKIFFNYGLVFLIIETYTVICSRLVGYMPGGVSALLIGGLLIGTAKLLQNVYLKKRNKSDNK